MTPGAIIALIKDALIILAIGAVVLLLVNYGKDIVKVADMKAVQKQLTQNAATEANWRKEQADANTKRDTDLATVRAAIDAQRAPVYVMRNGPPRVCPVSVAAGQAGRPPPATGGADAGSGNDRQPVDIRPELNRFELKAETAVADCRAALDGWPSPK
jgi:hypothetical protein